METIKHNQTLFHFSTTGGCAAKLNAGDLHQIIGSLSPLVDRRLLTDFRGNEDAAVYELTADKAIIATVDVIAPPVADANLYGQIAAANSLSDVYAMGGRPLLCLSILGVPEGLGCSLAKEIVAGANQKAVEAGTLLAGGHTVRNSQLLFGLAAIGIVHPAQIWTNSRARGGDAIIISKPIGMGVLFSALRQGLMTTDDLSEAVGCATALNQIAADVLSNFPIHAVTDITGFGVLGHALEITKASGVTFHINSKVVPIFHPAIQLYEQGIRTSITMDNLELVNDHLYRSDMQYALLQVLVDPQTNGGLLVTLPGEIAGDALYALHNAGVCRAAIIGTVSEFNGKQIILE